MSIFKSEAELNDYVKHLLKESAVNEANGNFTYKVDSDRKYKTDAERREMVRKLREVEAEENSLRDSGNIAEADQKRKEAQQIIDALFYEVELVIYSLADSLTSGPNSKRSGNSSSAYVHNTEEDLKAVGVREFLRVIEGGTMTDKNGTRKTGFDPDGPGTFISFVAKCVEGVMKNCHTKEKKHRDEISLDAPRGDNDEEERDTNLYNNVFADSTLRFDKIGDDDYEKFLDSEAFQVVMECLKDIVPNQRDIDVFKYYFGVDGYEHLTPTQIGAKYGFSKQRANNIVNNVLGKLKNYFSSDSKSLYNSVDDSDARFILKIGEKFASSPLSQLTDNPNKAGIIHGKKELDAVTAYWESKTSEKIEAIDWKNRSSVIKEGNGDEEENDSDIESTLNGKTLAQARRAIFKFWDFDGFYTDDSWEPVHTFFRRIENAGIYYTLLSAEYRHNQDGNPSNKIWKLEFKFKNQNDKVVSVYGTVTASGAGTVEDPLSRYDLCFECY